MPVKILIRYGEIALKGKNRGQFEKQLHRNLKAAVRNYSGEVIKLYGRFMVTGPGENLEILLERLCKVFGVVSISSVRETELDMDQIKDLAAGIVGSLPSGHNTFKIETRRSNKNFPYSSPEINQLLGSHLQELFPDLIVNLKQPSFKLSVEIGFDQAFLYLDRLAGPGGLPVGTTGRSLLMLSGGIDSPVAGWLSMKRGLSVEALHFHSFPFTSKHSQEKVRELCRKLAAYGGKIPLHMISVTAIQKELRAKCPEELGIILLRRMMFRLADLISKQRGLQALITGDSLGQVASQTLESITVITAATEMLVLRPLVGLDKREIIDMAIDIDTYDTSILPYEDCCTVFLPKHPVTKPKLEVIERFEAGLQIEEMLEGASKTLETAIIKSES